MCSSHLPPMIIFMSTFIMMVSAVSKLCGDTPPCFHPRPACVKALIGPFCDEGRSDTKSCQPTYWCDTDCDDIPNNYHCVYTANNVEENEKRDLTIAYFAGISAISVIIIVLTIVIMGLVIISKGKRRDKKRTHVSRTGIQQTSPSDNEQTTCESQIVRTRHSHSGDSKHSDVECHILVKGRDVPETPSPPFQKKREKHALSEIFDDPPKEQKKKLNHKEYKQNHPNVENEEDQQMEPEWQPAKKDKKKKKKHSKKNKNSKADKKHRRAIIQFVDPATSSDPSEEKKKIEEKPPVTLDQMLNQ